MNISKKRKLKEKWDPYAFRVPLLLIILVFLIVPIVKAAIMRHQVLLLHSEASPQPETILWDCRTIGQCWG